MATLSSAMVLAIGVSAIALSVPAGATETWVARADTESEVDGYPSVDELAAKAKMAPLVDALSKITGDEGGTVSSIDGHPNGFAGFKVDNATLSIDMYWVGEVPFSVRSLMDAHPEITVTVHKAIYSLVDMIAARDAVSNGYAEIGGPGELVRVGVDYQGRGITLGLVPSSDGQPHESVVKAIATLTSVPVHSLEIGEDQEVVPFSGGRRNDVSPHYGGAGVWITDENGDQAGYCSTGASVEGSSTGNKYMTTALHCMEAGEGQEIAQAGNVYNAANSFIGTWTWTSGQLEKNRHAILIKLKSGSTNSGRLYWGTNAATFSNAVSGTTTSPLGDTVCATGANSGTHCGGVVTDKNFTLIWDGVSIVNMVEAVRPSAMMAAKGDSGGPVVLLDTSGSSTQYRLAGFVFGAPEATSTTAACGSVDLFVGPTVCSRTLWYTGGVNSALIALNVDLR